MDVPISPLVRASGRITNTGFQDAFDVAKRTAHRDLAELVEKSVLKKIGKTGKGTYYVLRKGARKGPKGPRFVQDESGSKGSREAIPQ